MTCSQFPNARLKTVAHWSGLMAGYFGLFSVLCYVGMLIVIIIDITDRPLSKARLVIMGLITLTCFLLMMYKVYYVIRLFSSVELGFGIIKSGLALFVCSNLFMLGYCAFSYKNDYIIPEADDSVLDGDMNL